MKHYVYLSLSVFLFLFSCSNSKEKDKNEEKETSEIKEDRPSEVKATLVQLSDFNYELISNGTIAAMDKADLKFQGSENIARIYVKNGDRVSKGQKIAELDQYKLQIGLNQAKDNLERAKLDFQDILIGQGYSPQDTTKIPKDILKIAKVKSNYDQSQNNYKLTEYNLKSATLYAPFSGIVANLFAKQHNAPLGGEAFCTIIDNDHTEVVFSILENEIPLVKVNDKVIVSPFSINDYVSEGRIKEINPFIDRNGMVKVKATVNNTAAKLYEGMNVKVKVQRLLGKQLIIPKTALVLRTNKKVVFTLKNNRAIWNYVQTAQENSDSYVVTEGLTAGDSVIYEGNINLAHEAPVKVMK